MITRHTHGCVGVDINWCPSYLSGGFASIPDFAVRGPGAIHPGARLTRGSPRRKNEF